MPCSTKAWQPSGLNVPASIIHHQYVEIIICYKQLFFIIAAMEKPMDRIQSAPIILVKYIEWAVLFVILRQPSFSTFILSTEYAAPLIIPPVLRLTHILFISTEGHTQRNGNGKQFGMFGGKNICSKASHRVTYRRTVLPVCNCAVLPPKNEIKNPAMIAV